VRLGSWFSVAQVRAFCVPAAFVRSRCAGVEPRRAGDKVRVRRQSPRRLKRLTRSHFHIRSACYLAYNWPCHRRVETKQICKCEDTILTMARDFTKIAALTIWVGFVLICAATDAQTSKPLPGCEPGTPIIFSDGQRLGYLTSNGISIPPRFRPAAPFRGQTAFACAPQGRGLFHFDAAEDLHPVRYKPLVGQDVKTTCRASNCGARPLCSDVNFPGIGEILARLLGNRFSQQSFCAARCTASPDC
jgi:hypothetical protein